MPARPAPSRLFAYSGGFLGPSAQARTIRRILELSGHRPRLGWPDANDAVAAWGHSPRAARAEAVAARSGAALWRSEVRSRPSLCAGAGRGGPPVGRRIPPTGRLRGEPPMGLLIDRSGVHYDPARPSDLETLLATHPFDDATLIARAKLCIARMRHLQLSKYNAHDPALAPPAPGYVLVVDQVRGDASLRHGSESGPLPEGLFREMLAIAQIENPGARILVKTHPETAGNARLGHFTTADATGPVSLETSPHAPWSLLEGAVAVYTVSSQLGFEAILAGHRPRVFGQPFYAGWGLTQDRAPVPARRMRPAGQTGPGLAALIHATLIAYPRYLDPLTGQPCPPELLIERLAQGQTGAPRPGLRLLSKLQGALATHAGLWR